MCIALYAGAYAFGVRTPVNEVVLAIACVPRLHDIGRSGWWFLSIVAVEVVGVIAGLFWFTPETVPVVLAATSLVILGLLVVLGLIQGEPVENQFGPVPEPGLSFKKSNNKP